MARSKAIKCTRTVCKTRCADPKEAGWHQVELTGDDWKPMRSGWYCQNCTDRLLKLWNDIIAPDPPGPIRIDGADPIIRRVVDRKHCAYPGCGATAVFRGNWPSKSWGGWSHFGGMVEWPHGFYCSAHGTLLSYVMGDEDPPEGWHCCDHCGLHEAEHVITPAVTRAVVDFKSRAAKILHEEKPFRLCERCYVAFEGDDDKAWGARWALCDWEADEDGKPIKPFPHTAAARGC